MKKNSEIQMRIDEIIRQAELKLDIFYHDHGEWDGRRVQPFRKRGVLHIPDQENDEDPETEPDIPEIPEDGMSIIEPDILGESKPLSDNMLKMIDKSVKNFVKRVVGKPVDLEEPKKATKKPGKVSRKPGKASRKPAKPSKHKGRTKASLKAKTKKKPFFKGKNSSKAHHK
jgi:hypothetical protein